MRKEGKGEAGGVGYLSASPESFRPQQAHQDAGNAAMMSLGREKRFPAYTTYTQPNPPTKSAEREQTKLVFV